MHKVSSFLDHDHARCDALYVQSVAFVIARDWERAAKRFSDFSDSLLRHMAMEESIVYPAFEEELGTATGPTQSMRSEHLLLRGLLHRLSESIEQKNVIEFSDHADTFRITMQQHNLKEEGILYPMVDRVLRRRHGELVSAMIAITTEEPQ
jgi:iron-sulfur cluster repair protein YtfE (RIC family)